VLKVADDDSDDPGDPGDDGDDGPHAESHKPTFFGNVFLGAPQKWGSFETIQEAHSGDSAFQNFRACFEKALNELLHRDVSPVQPLNNSHISVADGDFVSYLLYP
jgi:hypothetical protein